MTERTPYIGRKSPVAYVRTALATLFWLVVWGGAASLAFRNDLAGLGYIAVGIALVALASGLYTLAYLRTERWIVADDEVRMESGILPWRKTSFGCPYETIFEAFYTFGFFAKLFNYGTVTIRRTEGVTTHHTEHLMHDAAKLAALINTRLDEIRKLARGHGPAPARSPVEELAELARLRANGDIGDDDYDILKGRIIGRAPTG